MMSYRSGLGNEFYHIDLSYALDNLFLVDAMTEKEYLPQIVFVNFAPKQNYI